MCGRFSITKEEEVIEARFGAKFYTEALVKRWNVAPTDAAPVITNREPERIRMFRWGLVPYWSKDKKAAARAINARSETLLEKPSFRHLVDRKRCLVITDGFYEWKKDNSLKIPHRIHLANDGLFAFAGLWDSWKDPVGEMLHSFTIITVEPNKRVATLHDRMPAMLLPEHEKLWLDEGLPTEDILKLLYPYPDDHLEIYEVANQINYAQNDEPEMIRKIQGRMN